MRRPSRSPSPLAPSPPAEGGRRKGRRTPCCTKEGLKRGPWTPEEDEVLSSFVRREGEGRWRTLPKRAGLLRCGKSCRLRWMNYLRPSIKHGGIAPDEEDLILRLHRLLGNRWSLIAGRIPGRTDNEIKNYWNSHLSKKLISQGLDPRTHKPLNPNPNPNPNPILQDQRMKAPMQAPIAPNPNRNPEPNGEPNFVSSNLGETYDRIGKSMGSFFQVGESNLGSAGIDLDCGELWRGPKEVGMVSMQEKGHNGVDFGIADDAFYSFIDSIINQDLLLQELHEQIISNEDDGNGNGDDNA